MCKNVTLVVSFQRSFYVAVINSTSQKSVSCFRASNFFAQSVMYVCNAFSKEKKSWLGSHFVDNLIRFVSLSLLTACWKKMKYSSIIIRLYLLHLHDPEIPPWSPCRAIFIVLGTNHVTMLGTKPLFWSKQLKSLKLSVLFNRHCYASTLSQTQSLKIERRRRISIINYIFSWLFLMSSLKHINIFYICMARCLGSLFEYHRTRSHKYSSKC